RIALTRVVVIRRNFRLQLFFERRKIRILNYTNVSTTERNPQSRSATNTELRNDQHFTVDPGGNNGRALHRYLPIKIFYG
ncbi:hypothetical protein, partial [Paraburkholderia sp. RL17-373-BIF-A]|uniref:hypothetical protein n=1 Tax=Paraburkholderia sp. RL17-373-BIF-A TaxID=3031629 RepID=UPI0038BCC9C9